MKPVHRHTLLAASLLLCLNTTASVQAEPLTDFEQFRSYPYMDRGYREAKNGNWKEVERLMRHLLSKVPEIRCIRSARPRLEDQGDRPHARRMVKYALSIDWTACLSSCGGAGKARPTERNFGHACGR